MQIQHSSQFMKARQPRQVCLVVYLMQNLRLRGRAPPIIFAHIVRPMNALQLCRWQFSHECYSWGAASENRSKNGDFAPTRSLWLKISGKKGRSPPIIFARIVRPMNALQLCPRQFSHSCYSWGAMSNNRAKIGDFAPTQSLLDPKFQVQGVAPTDHFCTVS